MIRLHFTVLASKRLVYKNGGKWFRNSMEFRKGSGNFFGREARKSTSRFFEILVARVPFFRPNEFWSGDRVIFSPAEVEKRTHRDSLEAALGWETRLSFLELATRGEKNCLVPAIENNSEAFSLDSLEISTRQWTLARDSSAYARRVKSTSELEFEGTTRQNLTRTEGTRGRGELKWSFVKFFVGFNGGFL